MTSRCTLIETISIILLKIIHTNGRGFLYKHEHVPLFTIFEKKQLNIRALIVCHNKDKPSSLFRQDRPLSHPGTDTEFTLLNEKNICSH